MDLAPYIDNQIKIQRAAIQSQQRQVKTLVFCGIAIILISLIVDGFIFIRTGQRVAWGLSDFLKLGGTFVGVVAAFPYKDIPPKKALVENFELLRNSCHDWDRLPAADHQFCMELAKIVIGQAPK
jgi:hypothetical protein